MPKKRSIRKNYVAKRKTFKNKNNKSKKARGKKVFKKRPTRKNRQMGGAWYNPFKATGDTMNKLSRNLVKKDLVQIARDVKNLQRQGLGCGDEHQALTIAIDNERSAKTRVENAKGELSNAKSSHASMYKALMNAKKNARLCSDTANSKINDNIYQARMNKRHEDMSAAASSMKQNVSGAAGYVGKQGRAFGQNISQGIANMQERRRNDAELSRQHKIDERQQAIQSLRGSM